MTRTQKMLEQLDNIERMARACRTSVLGGLEDLARDDVRDLIEYAEELRELLAD